MIFDKGKNAGQGLIGGQPSSQDQRDALFFAAQAAGYLSPAQKWTLNMDERTIEYKDSNGRTIAVVKIDDTLQADPIASCSDQMPDDVVPSLGWREGPYSEEDNSYDIGAPIGSVSSIEDNPEFDALAGPADLPSAEHKSNGPGVVTAASDDNDIATPMPSAGTGIAPDEVEAKAEIPTWAVMKKSVKQSSGIGPTLGASAEPEASTCEHRRWLEISAVDSNNSFHSSYRLRCARCNTIFDELKANEVSMAFGTLNFQPAKLTHISYKKLRFARLWLPNSDSVAPHPMSPEGKSSMSSEVSAAIASLTDSSIEDIISTAPTVTKPAPVQDDMPAPSVMVVDEEMGFRPAFNRPLEL